LEDPGHRFEQPVEKAFAAIPPDLHFGLKTGECEGRKMQLRKFEHAHQNCSSLSTAKSFAAATGSTILSRAAK